MTDLLFVCSRFLGLYLTLFLFSSWKLHSNSDEVRDFGASQVLLLDALYYMGLSMLVMYLRRAYPRLDRSLLLWW